MPPTPPKHLRRELETVRAMIGIYCRDLHGARSGLCDECEQLWVYAQDRAEHCPFGYEKPTCAKCTVHCYRKDMRARIRQVMRHAGPRMMWRHPWLTLVHVLHGIGEPPNLRSVRKRQSMRTRRLDLTAWHELSMRDHEVTSPSLNRRSTGSPRRPGRSSGCPR